MTITLHDTLRRCGAFADRGHRVLALRANDGAALRIVLQYALHRDLVWMLPDRAVPPYRKANDFMGLEGRLAGESKRLYLFISVGGVPGNPGLNSVKREQMFVQLLESLHPEDAELLLMIKDKRVPEGLDHDIVAEAFPDMFVGESPLPAAEEAPAEPIAVPPQEPAVIQQPAAPKPKTPQAPKAKPTPKPKAPPVASKTTSG
jgi:hypothetical protein